MAAYEVEAPPGGETVADLKRRFASWVDERRRAPETVLAFTHAGVIRVARSLALEVTYADVVGQPVEHLVPERLEFRNRESQFRVSGT